MTVTAAIAVATAEDDLAIDAPPPVNGGQNADVFDLGENFDRRVFDLDAGGAILRQANAPAAAPPAGVAGGDATSASLERVRGIADERFARIDAVCGLTEPQRRKLRIAIESDVRRTADAIDEARQKYRGMRVSQQDPPPPKQFTEWMEDVHACRMQLELLCDDEESLLMKALPSTLDAEQHARLSTETNAILDCRWRAIVARVLIDFDDSLGLDERQHEKLEALLLAERPRLRIGGRSRVAAIQCAPQLVCLSLARIGNDKVASIVSPRQGKLLGVFANRAERMRQQVELQGLLEKER